MTETLIGTFLGALLGGLASLWVTRWQMKKESQTARDAYLYNLKDELEYNFKVADEIWSYLMDGPHTEHLLSPATVLATHLQTTAWGDLIRAGVMTGLDVRDQTLLIITDRAVKNLRKAVEVGSANLPRIKDWEQHDVQNRNPQPASVKVFLPTAMREMQGRAEYAKERITQALNRLKELLDSSQDEA